MMTINGVEFDIDFLDAETMEKVEDAATKIQADIAAERKKNYKRSSEFVKAFCGLVNNFFDTILGEGSSQAIFGNTNNMMEHMTAYEGLFEAKRAAESEVSEFAEKFSKNYSPNRATRRAQQKGTLTPVK